MVCLTMASLIPKGGGFGRCDLGLASGPCMGYEIPKQTELAMHNEY